jgi:hypothetical protein
LADTIALGQRRRDFSKTDERGSEGSEFVQSARWFDDDDKKMGEVEDEMDEDKVFIR